MVFNLLSKNTIKSSELQSERRALVRALITRQLSQRPRDTWDGINNLVGAISSRIAQNQLDTAETAGQLRSGANLASLVDALKKRQTTDADRISGGALNTWPDLSKPER